MTKARKYIKKIGRVVLWILLCFFTLIILLFIFINLPVGKRIVRNQAQIYLQKKLGNKIVIGSLDYSIPNWVELKNLYVEDLHKDTLLYAGKIRVDIHMLKLISGNTDIEKILLQNITANINRAGNDPAFNFQFIIDAFSSKSTTVSTKDTSALKISIHQVQIDSTTLQFKDQYAGSNFYVAINKLDIRMDRFQPDRMRFQVNNIYANGIDYLMTTYQPGHAVEEQVTDPVETKNDTGDGYPLFVSANKLDLRDVNVLLDDQLSGMYFKNKVARLSSTAAMFNMESSAGTLETLFIDSTSVIYSAAKATVTATKPDEVQHDTALPWNFTAGHVSVKNTDVRYDDNNKAMVEGLDPSHLRIQDLHTTIKGFHFSKEKTTALVSQLAFFDSSGFKLDSTHVNFIFTDKNLSVKDLYVKTPLSLIQNATEVSYDSINGITTSPQNSSVNATISKSVIAFNDIFLLVPSLKTSLGGFADQFININTQLKGTLQRIDIPYFAVSGFSGSSLDARGVISNITDPKKFAFDIFILKSNFLKKDLLKFIPKEKLASFEKVPDVFNLTGHFVGNTNDVVANLKMNAKDFSFSGNANLKNISDPSKLKYDVSVSQLAFDKNLIEGFLPAETMKSISLPQKISASGKLDGNKENISADLKISSSYGPIAIKGYVNNISNAKTANYDLLVSTPGFAMGTLLRQDSVLGNIAGNFTVKGVGFDYKTMRSSIMADIATMDYNKYHYQNALIKARLENGTLVSTGNINDSSLKVRYELNGDLSGDYPTFEGFIRVDTAELMKLNLYDDTLNFSLSARINSKSLKPRNLDASLLLDSIQYQASKLFFKLDTISVVATSAAGIDSIVLKSAFADVHAGGAFDYDKVAMSVEKYINSIYKIPGFSATDTTLPDQQVAIKGTIKYVPVFSTLVPDMVDFEDIHFAASYNSTELDSALHLMVDMPSVLNTATSMHGGKMVIQSTAGKINYEAGFDSLKSDKKIVYGLSVAGAVEKDSIIVTARTKDYANNDQYRISASALSKGDGYTFRMKDSLMLNSKKWEVNADNYISYSPAGLIISNFLLSGDLASISVNSEQPVENSPIEIDISKFDIKNITSLFSKDTLLASGVLDVKAKISDLQSPLPRFIGDVDITDLQFMQQPLGNIAASAQNISEDNIEAKITLLGAGNDISASGNYYPNETENQFNAELLLRQLNFKTLEAFSGKQISNASGSITGEIKANGKIAEPTWNGQLNFDTTRFTVTQLGTPFKIDKQKIVFDYPSIKLPEFTIMDSLDHPLRIDGAIELHNMNNIGLQLKLDTKDFVFVNAKKTPTSKIYGYGAANVNVSVNGTAEKPKIEGDIELNKKTALSIALPESSYEKNDGKTIVRFIDMDTFDIDQAGGGFEEKQKQETAFGKFLNYNLNVFVNKEASLSLLLDPQTGDEIKVQGDANLNAGVDPGGNLVLAGTYELDKGYYDLHYQILNRKFELEKGSTITFAGPPLNANANLSAFYTANTSSRDLLSNEISDASSTLANSFNQQLPFKVILKLKGQLGKPDISFDIQLPDGNNSLISSDLRTAIENKLQQIRSDPASMNKQVFSLLLFGRFIPEQSSDFFKGSGTDFSMMAKQSVSQFLSSALNQIASDVFKGVDIDLNLNSYNDYSNGGNAERTDLKVAVSKNFANDRIRVTVGESIGLEGPSASNSGNSYIPDISVSYKLSKDGKYMIRAYSKNQYEVTVAGYMIETGLAFLMTLDYEKFRELFAGKKREKK